MKPIDQLIAEINALCDEHFPPTKIVNGTKHGCEIYYFGNSMWVLGGQTPVPMAYVVHRLKEKGADVSVIQAEIAAREAEAYRERERMTALREAAKAKLTPEEIEACGLHRAVNFTVTI